MRQSIIDLINMGPLPSENNSDINLIQKYQELLHNIHPPISDEEASHLTLLFGEDECYGLAWTLLHLIEMSNKKITNDTAIEKNIWIERLMSRASK